MNPRILKKWCNAGIVMMLILLVPLAAGAYDIPGIAGTGTGTPADPKVFNLTTGTGTILTGDSNSIHMWLYGVAGGTVQYPGPTLIVNQGDTVTINLTNSLPVPVSLVAPGLEVTAAAVLPAIALPGLLTKEVPADNGATTVSYTFTAGQPGTYLYQSGTNQALQIEMGLFGAIIVRPTGFDPTPGSLDRRAYGDTETAYDHENLFLLSDIDIRVHDAVLSGNLNNIDLADFHSVYWFINGRTLPDTLAAANAPFLKFQPYNSIVLLNPGQRVLYRLIGAGRQGHPFHTHGNHHLIIAKDSQFLSTGAGADLSRAAFTTGIFPGETADAIMTWTGAGLGWDVYGHASDVNNIPLDIFPGPEDFDNNGNGVVDVCAPGVGLETGEDEASHCVPFPVDLPNILDLTFGQFYSGSPFLGEFGALPPGEGGFNAFAGFFFMQHSHNEKELTNNNIFPGGLATFLIVVPPSVPVQ